MISPFAVSRSRLLPIAFTSPYDVKSEGKKITKIEGVDQINAIPEILQLQLEFKEGDIIEKAQDDRSRVGFFIARAESKERIEEIEKEVKNTLKVSFES